MTVIFLFEISLKACNESSKEAWFVFFLFVFGADCYDEFAQIFIQLLWRDLFKFSFLVLDARNRCSMATFCKVFFLVLSFSCSEMKSSTDTSKSLNLDAILFDEK